MSDRLYDALERRDIVSALYDIEQCWAPNDDRRVRAETRLIELGLTPEEAKKVIDKKWRWR